MRNLRWVTLAGLITAAAFSRLLPHPPNVSPVTAIALFGGAYFADKRLAFLVPLAALFLSDTVLGFYPGMAVVYGTFALIVCVGFLLQKQKTAAPVIAASLFSSILFFAVTNFGVWVFEALYPKTIQGLMACYAAAIPFFRHTVLGDLGYTVVLFGSFFLAEKTFPALRRNEPLLREPAFSHACK